MGTDAPAIFAVARDITVTGGILFILIASYLGKFWWTWQVDKALLEKDKVIATREAELVVARAEIATLRKEREEDNNYYRDIAWGALTAAKETASVGKEIVVAARERRAR